MKTEEVLNSTIRGFVEGVGIDSITWALAGKIPKLKENSPIKLPFYDPEGVHYDDLTSLIVSLGVAVGGATKGDIPTAIEGGSMVVGNVVISQVQP